MQEILQALKSMGRLKAQGYFYGQPEDAEGVRARLRAAGRLTGAGAEGTPAQRAAGEDEQTLYRIARP